MWTKTATDLGQGQSPCECKLVDADSASQVLPENEEDALVLQLLDFETSKTCTTSWLHASLDNAVSRLFRISALIAKATTTDKFARAEIKYNLSMYEPYDIDHIREKVEAAKGLAPPWLISRLGKANTKRRHFLVYSREHREDLSNESAWMSAVSQKERYEPIDKTPYFESLRELSSGRSEGTKISVAPTKASTVGQIDPDAFDYGADDAQSFTTVATSVVDGQAFSALNVPALEKYASPGAHFVCPLCHTMQRFNGQKGWRQVDPEISLLNMIIAC